MAGVVVIRLGESNSFGSAAMGTLQAQYQQTLSSIQTWTGSSFTALNYATNNNQYPAATNCFASEFSILTKIQNHYGGTVYDIKYGVNASHLGTAQNASANWNVNTRGSYFDGAISTINSAVAHLWNSLLIRDFKIFIFWDHGINDSISLTDSNNYQTNYQNLQTRILSSFGTAITQLFWITPLVNTNVFRQTLLVANATNATPIVISTASPHGFSTGKYVDVEGVLGNTAANGDGRIVTVLNTSTFSLNGTTGNGTYTSGGKVNDIAHTPTVKTAEQAVAVGNNIFNYSTESFSLGADQIHWDASGYEAKGDYAVTNIIIANNL